MSIENVRANRENFYQESLAIFDLLREGKTLDKEEKKAVNKGAVYFIGQTEKRKTKI